jgi:hypothetical protein
MRDCFGGFAGHSADVSHGGIAVVRLGYARWRSYFPAPEFSRYHVDDARRQCHMEFQAAVTASCHVLRAAMRSPT